MGSVLTGVPEGDTIRPSRLGSPGVAGRECNICSGTIIYAEGYCVVGDLCDDVNLPLDEDVRPRILAGKSVSARQYLDALAERDRLQCPFAAALDAF